MTTAAEVKNDLKALGSFEKAKGFLRFFRTGKGQYGEGDKFFGLTTPELKGVVKRYRDLELKEVQKLLQDGYHECRSAALGILKWHYKKADKAGKKKIVYLYLKNTKLVNNWDLVDISAPNILGDYLFSYCNSGACCRLVPSDVLVAHGELRALDGTPSAADTPRKSQSLSGKNILYRLARSTNLWEKRIAIIATFAFIHEGQFDDTLAIAEILLNDEHDLIHKAVGWMLREIGKRDLKTEENFLEKYATTMPRTMLRYAIEKFEEEKRQYYLKFKK